MDRRPIERTLAEVCTPCSRFVRPQEKDGVKTCPKCGEPITPFNNGIRKAA